MEWIIFIIVIFALFALLSNNNTKKSPEDLYSKATAERIEKSNESIENSRELLRQIKEVRKIKISSLKNEATFEITGIHIAVRKNRIINTCEVDDEIIVSAEPKNKFDKNAIMIENHDGKIGYIKSEDTDEVHPLITGEHYSFISMINNFNDYLDVEITIRY